ncbi:class IV adenylate cyclase [Candidatus Poribacteria bacterium]|nr:class IV adenylate cyclase [Candidatus Poribacteria bacterium]MYF54908.1 class IV adenylate cyclase [Candidatus Poribacteria bacterium]MYI93715.1 class IV adenylate cyclase [Candidatus Poribacteria bacterium]
MPKNLEYKVRYESLDKILPKLRILGATHRETIYQVDTYFNSPKGRLKLRETDDSDESWLIYYERPNKTDSRYSLYQLCKITQGSSLRELLTAALRIKTVVKKERSVWMYKNTRIHLDTVVDLGEYVELETVFQGQTETDAITEHAHVKHTLELNIAEPIAVSYSDMSIQKTSEA